MALVDNKISRFASAGGIVNSDDLLYILRDPTGAKEDVVITGAELKASMAEANYPVGTLFITLSPDDPADLLGFGTWTRIAKGRTLIGLDEGNPDYDTPGETGP